MTEKEKILEEIKILQRQKARINSEIPKLWDKYYSLNEKKNNEQ